MTTRPAHLFAFTTALVAAGVACQSSARLPAPATAEAGAADATPPLPDATPPLPDATIPTDAATRDGAAPDLAPADGASPDAAAPLRDAAPIPDVPVDRGPPDSIAACSTPCPAQPPAHATPCACPGRCHYDVCAGNGRTTATCTLGAWAVAKSVPCTSVRCEFGGPCPAGQICVLQASGALISYCAPNLCGASPISCACAASACRIGQCQDYNVGGLAGGDPDISCVARCDTSPCPP